MAKLKSFVRLDFLTVKPYFTAKNLLVYVVIAMFLTVTSGSISMALGVGMMYGTLFAGYPFAMGEKMDALYSTLSVNRKTVVLGRYAFTLALDVCAMFFSLMFAAISRFAMKILGFEVSEADTVYAVLALLVIFFIVQAIQLPLFFKLGYSKAKFFTVVPFLVIMAGFLALTELINNTDAPHVLVNFINFALSNYIFVAFALAALLCIWIYASYGLSLSFYKKREF